MSMRVEFDPNVRCAGNRTYVGLEDVPGSLPIGAAVDLYEPESGLSWPGVLAAADDVRRLAYFDVQWDAP